MLAAPRMRLGAGGFTTAAVAFKDTDTGVEGPPRFVQTSVNVSVPTAAGVIGLAARRGKRPAPATRRRAARGVRRAPADGGRFAHRHRGRCERERGRDRQACPRWRRGSPSWTRMCRRHPCTSACRPSAPAAAGVTDHAAARRLRAGPGGASPESPKPCTSRRIERRPGERGRAAERDGRRAERERRHHERRVRLDEPIARIEVRRGASSSAARSSAKIRRSASALRWGSPAARAPRCPPRAASRRRCRRNSDSSGSFWHAAIVVVRSPVDRKWRLPKRA